MINTVQGLQRNQTKDSEGFPRAWYRLAVVVAIVAIPGLLVLVSPAVAQTSVTTLVSNAGQPSATGPPIIVGENANCGHHRTVAIPFTTGANGAFLAELDLELHAAFSL